MQYLSIDDVLAALDPLPVKGEAPKAYTGHLAGTKMNGLDFAGILEGLGCTRSGSDGAGNEHWHYPRSENDTSCTVYAEDHHLTVWSETMAADLGLEVRRPYDPFGFWVYWKFGGDFTAAHTWLISHDITDAYTGGLVKASKPKEPPTTGLTEVKASKVTPTGVDWLWYGWLPAGKLVICDGDPDAGKSTLLLDIGARITRADLMPDEAPGVLEAGGLILLSGEDDMDDTIIWRLMAAGADLERVTHIQTAINADGEVPVSLPRDVPHLERSIKAHQARLIVVDVLDEYLDDGVDPYKNSAVRKALAPLRQMAGRTGTAVVLLRHLRKEVSAKAIYRGGGSIGIVGLARVGWAVADHPRDASMRVLAATKSNLAPRPESLGFKLVSHESYPCAYVDWRGPAGVSADQLLNPGGLLTSEEQAAKVNVKDQCRAAVKAILAEGDVWSDDLYQAIVKELGIGHATYDTVRSELTFAWPETKPDGTRGWKVRLK